jgi:sugar phosphate isomerase/epimerase
MLQCQSVAVYADQYRKLHYPCEVMDAAFPNYKEEDILKIYHNMNTPSLHGAFIDINFASNDEDIRHISQKKVEKSIVTGNKLGVTNVVIHSCCYPVLSEENISDLWCKVAGDFLMKMAQRYGVKIFVENTLDINPGILLKLILYTEPEFVGICLDVGHANLTKTPLAVWVDVLGPYIGYMHLNDNRGIFDEHLPIGGGIIDWYSLKQSIAKLEREPIMTIEVTKPSDFEQSIAYWEQI